MQTRSTHRVRKPGAARNDVQRPSTGSAAALPVLDERQEREFYASSHPMRITEHGTLKYLAVNDAAVKLYGYTREEFLKLTILQTRHPEEHDQLLAMFAEPTGFLRYGPPRRQIKKSGEIILAEVVTQDILFNGRKARLSLTIDVTERRRSEQALRERNAFLRSMIESSRDCIKVLDLDGRVAWISVGGQRLMETDDVSALVGKSYLDFWSGSEHDAARNALFAARAGTMSRFEGYCATTKGTPKWWDEIVTPILGTEGMPEKLLVVSRDITERKTAERALHENESKYRSLVESSSDLIWSADASGRLNFINQAVRRIYGHDPEEMLGKPVAELLGDAHWKKPFTFFHRMLAEDRSVADYECEVRSKDGQQVILSSNAIVLRDAAGKRIGVSGVSKDITARKRMEGELRQSEERFRQLAENIRQVFWIATLNHEKVIYISPAYEEIWGRSRHSLYRDPLDWLKSVHPDDRPAVQRRIENIAKGVSLNAEYRIIHPDGTLRWIRDRSYQMKAGDGTPLACGIAEDITDSKRAEQEKLVHAIHQRDALVREVHHRIKNSLQGIIGLLRQKIRKYPAIAPGIEEAIAQLQSVAMIYGLQGRELERQASLAEILDAICTSAENLTGGSVVRDFDRRNGQGMHVDEAEAVPLAVALNELVFNALKHQPAEDGEKRARVALRETKDAAEIRITNRGRLPADFDFVHGRAVGHGLGLVRTLIASPGGAITFTGCGEEVEVVLRLSPPVLAERETALAR